MLQTSSIVKPVGPGAPNDPLDVRVVQVLLNLWRPYVGVMRAPLNFVGYGRAAPIEDGVFSPLTQHAITDFQLHIERVKQPSGIISPGSLTIVLLENFITNPYSVAPGARLNTETKSVIKGLAVRFYCHTRPHFKITINSGTRTARSQADAMYIKLQQGDNLSDYKEKQAAQEIKRVYLERKQKNEPASNIVAAMTEVIENLMARNIYLSRHLQSKAFDVQNMYMSPRGKILFEKCAAGFGKFHPEGKPPHFHIQF